jgi:ligand-binding sensor domain-containing protein
MKENFIYTILFYSLLLYSCEQRNNPPFKLNPYQPNIIPAKAPEVRTIQKPPEVIPVKNGQRKPAGKPKKIRLNANVHPCGSPKSKPAGTPVVCTPGNDMFKLPGIVTAINKPVTAGIPEVVEAKEPDVKDNNPSGISSFKVLQGLKANNIFPMIQDKAGNIWISTWEGGVSKYDGRSFTHYTKAQGLSSDNVWSLLEDRNGNIWIGTIGGGVNKYDGSSFINYTTSEGMSDNDVMSIMQDKKGNLWFGTHRGGVIKFDGKTFVNFTTDQGLVHNHVRSIIQDRSGNIWFGTEGGLSKYDGKSFSNYTTHQGLNSNNIWCIVEDKVGNLWISSWGNGIDRYDGKSFTHYSSAEGLSSDNVWQMLEDKHANLWICTMDQGVIKFDGKAFTYFGVDQGLSNNVVHSILEDKSGNIWIGTDGGGVNRYDGGCFSHLHHSQGLTSGNISCTMEDRNGYIWVGTNGGGLSKYGGNTIEQYTVSQGLSNNNMNCVLEDSHGNLWIGTWGSGVDRYDGKAFTNFSVEQGLSSDGIIYIMEDKRGNLWFGTNNGVTKYDGISFTRFDSAQGLTNGFITCIVEDKAGNIWFSSYGGGMYKYDGISMSAYTTDQGLSSNDIYTLFQDSHDNIWVGTYDGGVNKFDGKFFTHYTTSQGLSNNTVGSIKEDHDGNMWFLTRNGLCRMSNRKLENSEQPDRGNSQIPLFKNYLLSDGFIGVGSDYNTLTVDRNGKIWAGAVDRLSCYNAGRDIPDTTPPNIQVKSISLFNENISWSDIQNNKDTTLILDNGIELKDFYFTKLSRWYHLPENLSLAYDNNYLSFQFVGIETKRTEHVKYQYFLEGFDKQWSSLTTNAEASYNNLPAGKYAFKVRAINSEGYASNEFAYNFSIRPPWWQTFWFRAFAVVILLSLFYTIIRWRLYEKFRVKLELSEQENQLTILKHKTADLEMQALRAQMNPHFIFNSLNSINCFILQNNKVKASEYLVKFSRLIRLILQNSQVALITLENELESLQLYLELEAVRFDHRFEFQISIAKEIDTSVIMVPPLLIQPFVENAIWHGLMNKKFDRHLLIELYYENEEVLCCKITDNGVGRTRSAELQLKSPSPHKSMGLSITEERIKLLQPAIKVDPVINITDLVLSDGTAGGTEVLLRIPVSMHPTQQG